MEPYIGFDPWGDGQPPHNGSAIARIARWIGLLAVFAAGCGIGYWLRG